MYKIVQQLRETTKGSEKERILLENDTPEWRAYLKETYNRLGRTFNVKKYNKEQVPGAKTLVELSDKIYKLTQLLVDRKLTGNAAIFAVEEIRSKLNAGSQDLFDGLMRRDVKCGIGITLINKCYKDLIPEFEVALAGVYDNKSAKALSTGRFYISRKLDGLRLICMNTDGDWTFLSRAGNEILVLDNLKKDLDKLGLSDVVIDGELCMVDDNGKEDFQGIMKEAHKKDHTIEHPMLLAFDFLKLSDFVNGMSAERFSSRLGRLRATFAAHTDITTVTVLDQIELTEETFADMSAKVEANGWEGLILRKDAPYKSGRSKDMLKVKKFEDAEYVINGVEIDTLTFAEAGVGVQNVVCVKALKITHKGSEVSVGSGMSKEQRITWYNNPALIVGKTATIKYFQETQNQNGGYSLRFPTLLYVYENGRNV